MKMLENNRDLLQWKWMGGWTSKVAPERPMYADVINFLYRKDKLMQDVTRNYESYKRMVHSMYDTISVSYDVYKLTKKMYENQQKRREKLKMYIDQLEIYDQITYRTMIQSRIQNLDLLYKETLIHLYFTERLIIDKSLLQKEDIRELFYLRDRIVRFSDTPTIYLIDPD